MELSQRLLRVRNALGETQDQFARRFPVSQPVYCRWENGRKPDGTSRALIDRVLAELAAFEQEAVK